MSDPDQKEFDSRSGKDVLGAAMAKDLGYSKEVWNNPYKPLSITEYYKIGMPAGSVIERRFSTDDGDRDGWSNLKNELGIEDNSNEVNEERDEEIMEGLTSSPDKEDVPDYMQP